MKAKVRLLRWLGIGVTRGSGFKSTATRRGSARWAAALLMLGGVTIGAHAQYQFGIEVNPDETLTIFGAQSCPGGDLIIPDVIDGRTVACIRSRAFWGCLGLTSVTIGNGVTSIGAGAFERCIGLTRVMIGNGVTNIEGSAFRDCLGLTSVTIGNGVTSIGNGAFAGCRGLTTVTIPESVTSVPAEAFRGCTGLTSIVAAPLNLAYSSVEGVLFNRDRTKLVAYPEGKGGNYTIPGSVTRIGDSAFASCTGLTSIAIPSSVTSIEDGAFMGCTGLTTVTISHGVSRIGDAAFTHCTGLTSITIPDSVTSIGSGAFYLCAGLKTVTIPGSIKEWADGSTDRAGWEVYGTFAHCESLKTVIIRAGVTRIAAVAFSRCGALNDITVPNSVTNIGYSAFARSGLTNVTIGNAVTSIGTRAFGDCASLQNVYFTGDSPPAVQADVFSCWDGILSPSTVYYLPGTRGWSPTLAGRPTAPWVRPNPTILDFGDGFGPSTSGFGFVISWATNVPVVVEASGDLSASSWTPISTNTLAGGWVQFTDPEWKSHPARFYRVRGQ